MSPAGALALEVVRDASAWDALLLRLPHAHLLQSWAWGDLKARYGWRAERLAWRDTGREGRAAAQLLTRALAGRRVAVGYCPRGPCLDWADQELRDRVLSDLLQRARARGAILLKIDPDVPVARGMPGDPGAEEHPAGIALRLALIHGGWRESPEQIQFRNTYRLDLRPSEDDLLAAMKQKTRYNVRLAERRGVAVRPATADDLEVLYRMYAETSLRDRFAIRAPGYYHDVWGTFMRAGLAQAFIAQVDGQPVAGLIVYRFGRAAYYLFGMSRAAHRDRMPNHRLQWEAIRWAKVQGCTVYDLWGAPDRLDARDRMWGVHRFKEGFGGDLVRTLGAWDYPLRPGLYRMYTSILPRVLALMRLRGRARVRATVEATL